MENNNNNNKKGGKIPLIWSISSLTRCPPGRPPEARVSLWDRRSGKHRHSPSRRSCHRSRSGCCTSALSWCSGLECVRHKYNIMIRWVTMVTALCLFLPVSLSSQVVPGGQSCTITSVDSVDLCWTIIFVYLLVHQYIMITFVLKPWCVSLLVVAKNRAVTLCIYVCAWKTRSISLHFYCTQMLTETL